MGCQLLIIELPPTKDWRPRLHDATDRHLAKPHQAPRQFKVDLIEYGKPTLRSGE
jgi:hypothetical protein